MKIGLNDRSAQELIALIEHNGNCSAKHIVQILITQAYKKLNLNSIPLVEEYKDENKAIH